MKETRTFTMNDRFYYDEGPCSRKNGFARVDTEQDAAHFGTWANPERFIIVTFAEGDEIVQEADTAGEFVEALRRIETWNRSNGHGFRGIDTGNDEALRRRFSDIGLGDVLK